LRSVAYSMSVEGNKVLVRRFIEEVWHKGNLGFVDENFAADYVDHHPALSGLPQREGFKGLVTMYRTAFPDLHFTIEDLIAEGDKVAGRWTARGTHKGPLRRVPPTGRQVTVTGITIWRIAGGKLAERWTNEDTLGLMQQLGIIPPLG